MSTLRYSVTVQFDVDAGDTETLERQLTALEDVGLIAEVKAKSAGKRQKKETSDEAA